MSSLVTSNLSTSFWIGKSSSHKLWQQINEFVVDYTSEHQSELETEWFRKWYFLIEEIKISNKSRDFQVIALSITGNPGASINECYNHILTLVPNLREHIKILEKSEKGSIRCQLDKYSFRTPKDNNTKKSPNQPAAKGKATQVGSNQYAMLAEDDEQPAIKDDLILSEMSLPVQDDFILEQHSTSTLSNESKAKPKDIKDDLNMESDSIMMDNMDKKPASLPTPEKVQPTLTQMYSNNVKRKDDQPKKPSSFGRFSNSTKNALRNVAYKAKDFANDKDFSAMIGNNSIFSSVRTSPFFQQDSDKEQHTVTFSATEQVMNNKEDFTFPQQSSSINNESTLHQKSDDIKQLDSKLQHMHLFISKFDWRLVEGGAKQLHNKYVECIKNINNHAASMESSTATNLQHEKALICAQFKAECSQEMHRLQMDFDSELNLLEKNTKQIFIHRNKSMIRNSKP